MFKMADMTTRSLQPAPRTARSRWAAVGAAIAVTLGAGGGFGLASAATDDGGAGYTAVTPCRLVDTRAGDNNVGPRSSSLGAGESDTFAARGAQGECSAAQLPANATALALNVTAVRSSQQTFLTFWPDGTKPNSSSLNPAPGAPPAPNTVITQLSSTGSFNVFNNVGDVGLIVDVVGYFTKVDLAAFVTEADLDDLATQTELADEIDNLLNVLGGTIKINTTDVAALEDRVDLGAPLDDQIYVVGRTDFAPINVGGSNQMQVGSRLGVYIPSGASNNQLWAPVHLPVGATIDTVQVALYDNIVGISLEVDLRVNGVGIDDVQTSGSSTNVQILGMSPGHTVIAGDLIEISVQTFGGNWRDAVDPSELEMIEAAIVYSEAGA